MHAAIKCVASFAYGNIGLRRLELRTAVTNDRSRALAESLGFQLNTVPDADPRGDMGEETVRYVMTAECWSPHAPKAGDPDDDWLRMPDDDA